MQEHALYPQQSHAMKEHTYHNTPSGLKYKKQKNKIGGLKYKKKYSKMNLLNATIPSLPSSNSLHH